MNATAELTLAPENAAPEESFAEIAEAAELALADRLVVAAKRRLQLTVEAFDWQAAAVEALSQSGSFPLVDSADAVLASIMEAVAAAVE